jgi:uncharacterized membrane protein
MLFFVSLLPFTTKLMAAYLGNPPALQISIYGSDLLAVSATVNAIMRSAISTPVVIYGLNLLAATLALVAIIRSAIITPDIHADESAENELKALLGREQLGAGIIVYLILWFSSSMPYRGILLYRSFLLSTITTAKAT